MVALPVPIFKKLTNAQPYNIKISYAEFHTNRETNAASMVTNSIRSPK